MSRWRGDAGRGRLLARPSLVLVLVAVLVVGAAGCQGSPEPETAAPGPGETGAAAPMVDVTTGRAYVNISPGGPPPTTTTLVAAVFEFVNFRSFRSSGAFFEEIKVFADGRVTFRVGQREVDLRVSRSSVVADLRAALDAADVETLDRVYGEPGPDDLQHRILYGSRSVRWVDGAAPPELEQAIAHLEVEIERGRDALG